MGEVAFEQLQWMGEIFGTWSYKVKEDHGPYREKK